MLTSIILAEKASTVELCNLYRFVGARAQAAFTPFGL